MAAYKMQYTDDEIDIAIENLISPVIQNQLLLYKEQRKQQLDNLSYARSDHNYSLETQIESQLIHLENQIASIVEDKTLSSLTPIQDAIEKSKNATLVNEVRDCHREMHESMQNVNFELDNFTKLLIEEHQEAMANLVNELEETSQQLHDLQIKFAKLENSMGNQLEQGNITLATVIKNQLTAIKDTIKDVAESVVTKCRDAIKSMKQGVKDKISDIENNVQQKVDGAMSKYYNMSIERHESKLEKASNKLNDINNRSSSIEESVEDDYELDL